MRKVNTFNQQAFKESTYQVLDWTLKQALSMYILATVNL